MANKRRFDEYRLAVIITIFVFVLIFFLFLILPVRFSYGFSSCEDSGFFNQFTRLFGDIECDIISGGKAISVKKIPIEIEEEIKRAEFNGCVPNFKCGEWSDCVYASNLGDILKGENIERGFRERLCIDIPGCVSGFKERELCNSNENIELEINSEINGKKHIIFMSEFTNKPIAYFDINSLRNKRLNVIFVQNYLNFDDSCYNSLLDSEERGVDCGGKCKECLTDKKDFGFFIVFIWMVLGILFLFFIVRILRNAVNLNFTQLFF